MSYTGAPSTGGSQISLSEYRQMARSYLKDWEYEDRLQAAVDAVTTTLTVINGSKFGEGHLVQLGSEYCLVESVASNSLTVRRGWRGSTATAHAADAVIFRGTVWTDDQLNIWINESFYQMYPYLYQRSSATLTGSSTSYDYDLSNYIDYENQLESVELHLTADSIPQRTRIDKAHLVMRGSTPYLYIPLALGGYTITITYVTPFPPLDGDNDKTTIPVRAKMLPVYYAAARAVEQRSNVRIRFDSYPLAQDERVSREGAQLQTSNYYWLLFKELRWSTRMPGRSYF